MSGVADAPGAREVYAARLPLDAQFGCGQFASFQFGAGQFGSGHPLGELGGGVRSAPQTRPGSPLRVGVTRECVPWEGDALSPIARTPPRSASPVSKPTPRRGEMPPGEMPPRGQVQRGYHQGGHHQGAAPRPVSPPPASPLPSIKLRVTRLKVL